MAALRSLEETTALLARQNHAVALRALARITNKRVAELLGISGPASSEWNTDHLERACQVLAGIGLRFVPPGEETYPPDLVRAWKTLARHGMDRDEDIGGVVVEDE